jgi:hypothetical protein
MSLRGGVISTIVAVAAVWAGEHGIRPRPTPDDYPARQTANGFTLAAAVLTPEQVKKRFAADLNHGYLVVEVAVYPEAGHDVKLATRDFMARFGSDSDTERPLSPQAIAARLGKKDTTPPPEIASKVHVYTEETVGYGTGGPNGPNGRNTGGVYTATGTGVGIGDRGYPPPAQSSSGGMDRTSIQLELDDLSLPDKTISEETAGYLYFPKPSKGKVSPLHLTYYGEQGQIQLTIPVK